MIINNGAKVNRLTNALMLLDFELYEIKYYKKR